MGDHPRPRGVYADLRLQPASISGSSPLARGLRAVDSPAPPRLRIIPARAGFTPTAAREPATTPDHPRSRGVYSDDMAFENHVKGSSPLARGLLTLLGRDIPCFRIIPARAGFTCRRRPRHGRRWDHPRSRGVYGRDLFTVEGGAGSSPLARGLRARDARLVTSGRIIPARAGFTRPKSSGRSWRWDHPRSRGVYRPGCGGLGGFIGSSPLARGLQSWGRRTLRYPADHPRSRGVYGARPDGFVVHGGSSPLARGLQQVTDG